MKDEIVKWIRNWFMENGNISPAVFGCSGGKDSSVVAALCVEALGRERVIGVLMPDTEQVDIDCSYKLVEHLGIPYTVINIGQTKRELLYAMSFGKGSFTINELTEQAAQNLPPRLRMSTLYLVSQCVGGRVMNTCNLSETLLGWETRWGDAVGDLAPLADLTVQEVKQLGYELGLPKELIEKVPSDGLCGASDEEKMGIKYSTLDNYIRTGECKDDEIKQKIDERIKANWFKHSPIPHFDSGKKNYITK